MPISDLSRDPSWQATSLSEEECIFIPPTLGPLSELIGLTRYHTPGELMHTGCLGVVKFLIASANPCSIDDSSLFFAIIFPSRNSNSNFGQKILNILPICPIFALSFHMKAFDQVLMFNS